MREFKLPDLGEGLTEGEILQWMVQVGDEVTLNQPIVEVETAKAAVEVPSPFAGVVTQLFHEAGTTVDVGSPIIEFDTDPSAGPLETAAGNAAAGAAANPVE
ncbi:MAG: bkdH, partial [Frankiales bacterium]|nr:bkdH [Frankiales bacterium]